MTPQKIERLRHLLMFVIAWLIGLYVFEAIRESSAVLGIIAAALTLIVNLYARKRAAALVTPTPAFYFWLYLPAILFFVVPIASKAIIYFTSDEPTSWWSHVYSLAPFVLQLGIPAGTLLWIYAAVGRLASSIDDEPKSEDSSDSDHT